MRGELLWVWSDTWREIWSPLADDAEAPEDLFCELYRELVRIRKEPTVDQFVQISLDDTLHSREAFHRALILAGAELGAGVADQLYDDAMLQEPDAPVPDKRSALEQALIAAVGRSIDAPAILDRALRDLATDPARREEARARALEAIYNSPHLSRQAFHATSSTELKGEQSLIGFMETVHALLDDLAGDSLSNRYFCLLSSFVEKFSLRYDVRRPCQLCPTLPGVFATLIRELKVLTATDAHLDALMKEYENAVRDLRGDSSEGKIKTCIQKQVNLLEALGRACPGVTQTTLGRICDQLTSWPHAEVKDAMKSMYGFTSDYPGIRHGGTRGNAIRHMDLRDMVAVSVLLSGFTPYLAHGLDADAVYRGYRG